MAPRVLGCVLSLAIFKITRFLEDASAVGACLLEVGPCVLHSDHHRMRHLAVARWPTVVADIPDDDRPVAETELRTVVLANPNTFCESKSSAQPIDCLTNVGVNENRNNRCRGDRAVRLQHRRKSNGGLAAPPRPSRAYGQVVVSVMSIVLPQVPPLPSLTVMSSTSNRPCCSTIVRV